MYDELGNPMPHLWQKSEYTREDIYSNPDKKSEPTRYNALGRFAQKVVKAVREHYKDPREDKGKLLMLSAHYGNMAMINSSVCGRA